MFDLSFLFICVLFYLIGSIPAAYIIVKRSVNKDVTKEGSGNVGTLNAAKVSKSKFIGIVVLIIDLLKGAIPVYLLSLLTDYSEIYFAIPVLLLIIGHNFPVWLKFKGGRGLAVTAGIFLVLNFVVLILWCLIWLIVIAFKKDILIANFAATLLFSIPVVIFSGFFDSLLSAPISGIFQVFTVVCAVLILIKHLEIFGIKI